MDKPYVEEENLSKRVSGSIWPRRQIPGRHQAHKFLLNTGLVQLAFKAVNIESSKTHVNCRCADCMAVYQADIDKARHQGYSLVAIASSPRRTITPKLKELVVRDQNIVSCVFAYMHTISCSITKNTYRNCAAIESKRQTAIHPPFVATLGLVEVEPSHKNFFENFKTVKAATFNAQNPNPKFLQTTIPRPPHPPLPSVASAVYHPSIPCNHHSPFHPLHHPVGYNNMGSVLVRTAAEQGNSCPLSGAQQKFSPFY